jgi:hypothetical protein
VGAALAAVVVVSACRGTPPRVVERVTVAEGLSPGRLAALGLDPEDLRRAALEAFAATPGFAVTPPQPPRGAIRCRATVALLEARAVLEPLPGGPAESAVPRAVASVELEVAPVGGEEVVREAARWAEPMGVGEESTRALRRAVEGAARKAAGFLAMALAEAAKPDAKVVADLEAGDARLRDYAVRVLADRRNPAAVPALVARLGDSDPEVVERAVGALAQIRDRRAVVPLIELSHRREGPSVAQLARIIGDIGGSEAESFLLTLASGHPEPGVRSAAAEALREIEARRADGGAPPGAEPR